MMKRTNGWTGRLKSKVWRKLFIQCSVIDGAFVSNIETTETKYFAKDEIPENLANEKTTKEQILMCFDAYEAKHWKVLFD